MNNKDLPAMPTSIVINDTTCHFNGLSKREYIAAMAMQSIDSNRRSYEDMAIDAVKMADALLKELDK